MKRNESLTGSARVAASPSPVGVVQEHERAVAHGVERLAQQPVFVLKQADPSESRGAADAAAGQTHLPRFVEAAVSRRLDVAELFLVLRRRRPGRVRGGRRQHDEERVLRTAVVQEVKGAVQLQADELKVSATDQRKSFKDHLIYVLR